MDQIVEFVDKIKKMIEEAKKNGVDIQPYEKKIKNGDSELVVERGIAVCTYDVDVEYIPTWKKDK